MNTIIDVVVLRKEMLVEAQAKFLHIPREELLL